MSRSSYNNIKKYAAFIFMIFTVLSGSSDSIDSDSFARIGRKAFVDMLMANRAVLQDTKTVIGQSQSKSSENESMGFRSFLDSDIESSSLNHIQVYILPFTVFVLYFNNHILKNNIWKNAVF